MDDSASVQNSNPETLKESVDFTGTNFTSLQDKINGASEGDTIELKNNIIQDGTSEITISKLLLLTVTGTQSTQIKNHEYSILLMEK